MYNEFLEKGVIYPDQEWQDYVTEVGERLLANSPHAGRNYTFVVVDQPVVNAWATRTPTFLLPAGFWPSSTVKMSWRRSLATKLAMWWASIHVAPWVNNV
ncbi:MAG: hypothetical protein CM15mP68_5280 [Pseudomonadota bacterium]|nr:MAG: hypothetical protein CM15mP68_5280 [Pseudomonadota bacterium]